ncbi:MAG: rhodanese-like domain-containing protein [Actinomycetota bacterium]
MDPATAHALLGSAQFLDVRRSHEYDAGHVDGAVWITLRDLPSRLDDVDRNRTVVVTCQIGQRSSVAAELLRTRGFDAYNLEGGIEAWTSAGFPLVASDGRSGRVIEGWAETLD